MEDSPRRIALRALTLEELKERILNRGLPEYRYRQMARWLWDKAVVSLEEMTDLSRDLRADLAREYVLGGPEVVARQRSAVDGSRKLLLRLEGGGSVESVLMPSSGRVTLCVSSQVGCTLDCIFCQTAQMGFSRNLAWHEIVGQIVPLWRAVRERRTRTNVVFMGMGEPLHNVDAVVGACRMLMDPLGFQIGKTRITVSTAGVVPGIRKLAESGLGVRLAVSLNASTDTKRALLMPRAGRTSIAELLHAARSYAETVRDRVTIEYVLMREVNDSDEDCDALADLVRNGPFKVNLIPYNPGASPELSRPSRERVDAFARRLWPRAPVVTVRWSQGPDIAAACGQLRTAVEGRPAPGEEPGARRTETARYPSL